MARLLVRQLTLHLFNGVHVQFMLALCARSWGFLGPNSIADAAVKFLHAPLSAGEFVPPVNNLPTP
jgi:hypothetical protein